MGTSGGAQLAGSPGSRTNAGQLVPARNTWTGTGVGPSASGMLTLGYFYADRTETISTLTAFSGATAAGATPTLCRTGIYTVAANGDLTLAASTPNDTTLWAATNTSYPKALSASYGLVQGSYYATALLIVTGAALPTFHGVQFPATAAFSAVGLVAPAFIGRFAGQTDLPGSVSAGSVIGYQALIGIQLS